MAKAETKPDTWMPLYVAKYLADTTNLNAEQHGAYMLLLMYGWTHAGLIPLDDKQRFQITRMSPKQWRESKVVLMAFFTRADGGYTQKRQVQEIEKAGKMVSAKSEAGKLGAHNRWHRDGSANGTDDGKGMAQPLADGMANRCQDDAPLPIPNTKARSKTTREPPTAFAPPDWVPRREWDDFDDMRRRKSGKAWTVRAREMAIEELAKLMRQGHDPVAVLRQSAMRSYSGLFPVGEAKGNAKAGARAAVANEIFNRGTDEEPTDITGESQRVG